MKRFDFFAAIVLILVFFFDFRPTLAQTLELALDSKPLADCSDSELALRYQDAARLAVNEGKTNEAIQIKSRISEEIGERGAKEFARNRGWEPILTKAEKSKRHPQGYDQVWRSVDGKIHVLEAKGGGSRPSGKQGTIKWCIDAAERTLKNRAATEAEKSAARTVVEAISKGNLDIYVIQTRHVQGLNRHTICKGVEECSEEMISLAKDWLSRNTVQSFESDADVLSRNASKTVEAAEPARYSGSRNSSAYNQQTYEPKQPIYEQERPIYNQHEYQTRRPIYVQERPIHGLHAYKSRRPINEQVRPIHDLHANKSRRPIYEQERPIHNLHANKSRRPVYEQERPIHDLHANKSRRPIYEQERPIHDLHANKPTRPVYEHERPIFNQHAYEPTRPIYEHERPIFNQHAYEPTRPITKTTKALSKISVAGKALAVVGTAVDIGYRVREVYETEKRYHNGDIDHHERTVCHVKNGAGMTAGWSGAYVGWQAGSKVGAAIGSIVPGYGNVVGYTIGGMTGAISAYILSEKVAEAGVDCVDKNLYKRNNPQK